MSSGVVSPPPASPPDTHDTNQAPKSPKGRAKPGTVRRIRPLLLLGALIAGVLVTTVLAGAIGQVPVSPAEVLGSFLHRLHLDIGPMPSHPQGEVTLWQVRFPRVAMGLLVGAGLGCAGALMQGVFGNPLAEPGVIGVSSGAAVGAFTVIVFGLNGLGSWTVVLAAFIGGAVTTLLVYLLSRNAGRTEVVTLILTGIAVNAFAGAVIGLFTFLSDDDALRAMAFWNLGSLSGSSWTTVTTIAPCVAAGIVVAQLHARQLDLLTLGDGPARHVGVPVERVRLTLVVVVAVLVASGVAFTGIIAFVGLVVPHIIRMIAGPGHRMLLPASALGGALVITLADLVARTVVPYQELPLGVLTALVGGPFFFGLLLRTRRRAGGWS